jgi:serine phosphatase RsbU (regulator of sigma subunit)
MLRKSASLVIFLVLSQNYFATYLDSLTIRLKNAKSDSLKIELIYKACFNKSLSDKTIDSLLNKITEYKTSKDCYLRTYSFCKVGYFYGQKESPQRALHYLIIALQFADSCGNKRAIMLARNRLALVNKLNENYKVAIKNAHISLSYAHQFRDSFVMAENYTLIGNIYKTTLILDSSLLYHYKALAIRERLKDESMIAITYNNLGLTYKNLKQFDKALLFLRKSMALKQKLNDKTFTGGYNNMAIVFKNMRKHDSAIYYAQKLILLAINLKSSSMLNQAISTLAEVYDDKKDMKNALHYYKRLRITEDSVKKEKLTAQYHDLQAKYESDKKDLELKEKENAIKLSESENSKKNVLIFFSALALIIVMVAGIFIYRSYLINKRNAVKLSLKNQLIEEKNKEITDSINYAKNIQSSLLTSEHIFKECLSDHFILFQPKDIVSGDFYWARKINNGFMIMCADCTGHGVPGAFMSLLGISYLNEIVNNLNLQTPNLILNELRNHLIEGFSLNNNNDGMDASLIYIKDNTLQLSAANNPVWIIRNKKNIVVEPNKFPIGKHYGEMQDFTLTKMELLKNDLLIMFTDGYADQFGGPKNKKFKYKKLEEVIVSNAHLPLAKIKSVLESEMLEWKGDKEQIDDILVLGIRI